MGKYICPMDDMRYDVYTYILNIYNIYLGPK